MVLKESLITSFPYYSPEWLLNGHIYKLQLHPPPNKNRMILKPEEPKRKQKNPKPNPSGSTSTYVQEQ
jgi:hypothetical protein